jgi:hydrogenase-4 component E
MLPLLNSLLVVVLLLNLFALGTSRIVAIIRAVAMQGALLGALPLVVHATGGLPTMLLSLATIVLKGGIIPWMLMRAMREVQIRREVEPMIGLLPSMILGALATGCAVLLGGQLPLAPEHAGALVVPAALATASCGFILLTTRIKAISQVLGYLLLENGIFIFGMLLLDALPFVVEMGALLDLFVAIFVIGIIVNHINREFASLDTRRLTSLKE